MSKIYPPAGSCDQLPLLPPTEASDDAELRRLKLSYSTPSLETKEAIAQWSSVLSQPDSLSDHDLRTLTLKGRQSLEWCVQL